MIILTATIWPRGNPAQAYEALHASITNQTSYGDESESHIARVLQRPHPFSGIPGFDATVETRGQRVEYGISPLIASVLSSAALVEGSEAARPESVLMARSWLQTAQDFETILRGHQ